MQKLGPEPLSVLPSLQCQVFIYFTEVSSSFLPIFPIIVYVGHSNSGLYNWIHRFQKELETQSGCNNR